MAKKVAINGFGRIGRLIFRQIMDSEDLELVALNDIAPLDNLAYLLKHDSVHKDPKSSIKYTDDELLWDNKKVKFLSIKDPAELPWNEMGVEIAIEASGIFTNKEDSAKHLEAGAERVVITAPAKGDVLTVCMGVNEEKFDPDKHKIVSNASCTTNCLAPVAKVLDEEFGIVTGFLTTIHAVTSSQAVVDTASKKWRRGRAAIINIVPTTTGAAIAVTKVLPHLEGKLDGLAMRVPVANGSIIDFVVHTEQTVSVDKVNDTFCKAAKTKGLKGILGVSDEELVSSDVIGSEYSAMVDLQSTMVLGDKSVKVLAWYDNEWGYARRVVDLTSYISKNI
ncbi:type I glyceraldehyde-3-phosphate dehydrogenase [Candidatus Poribacteria bacterium]|nr:type I glyceraldehyde-3-phosphate dehydrogenase [Candidatus Poribacteria bacterium]